MGRRLRSAIKERRRNRILFFLIFFPNSLIRAKKSLRIQPPLIRSRYYVRNAKANLRRQRTGLSKMERRIPTEISGPPPEVIPNIPVGRNGNGPFHLNSVRNFRNLWIIMESQQVPTSFPGSSLCTLREEEIGSWEQGWLETVIPRLDRDRVGRLLVS